MVLAKRNELLAPCHPYQEADGWVWRCAWCEEIICRVSFGVMNGNYRCPCGAELEISVDGHLVDLDRHKMGACNQSDEDFLKLCGISPENITPSGE